MKGKLLIIALAVGFLTGAMHGYTPKFYNDTDYPVMLKFPVQLARDMDYVIVPAHSDFSHKLFLANFSKGVRIANIMIPYEGSTIKVLDVFDELSDKKIGPCSFTYKLRAIIESEPGTLAGTIKPKNVSFELERMSCGAFGGMTKRSKKYDLSKPSSTPVARQPEE